MTDTVKKPQTGASDGCATNIAITSTTGVSTTGLVRCSPAVTTNCLDTGALSALVVDSLLAAGEFSLNRVLGQGE